MERPLVYFSVLNMGLGHATRSLPLIRSFLEQGWEVLLGSNGRALDFLKRELPQLSSVETPDYRIQYSTGIWLVPAFILQLPRLGLAIKQELHFTRKIAAFYKPTLIISDHCYGAREANTPSILIAHQIVFEMPAFFKKLRLLAGYFHHLLLKPFDKVLIPDIANGQHGLLSGRLSEVNKKDDRFSFIGPLSSLPEVSAKEKFDTVISISGPEPQRTVLENIILKQVGNIAGKTLVVLGRAETQKCLEDRQELKIFTHLDRNRLAGVFAAANLIVCRPGYSTLMELAFLGKPALFIPTPGQTEQEYLAGYHHQQGFYQVSAQTGLELASQIKSIGSTRKLMIDWKPADSITAFWREISPFLPSK